MSTINTDALMFAIEIGKQQFEQKQGGLTTPFDQLAITDQAKAAQADAVSLYIDNFWTHYKFLVEKLTTEKDENFHFFIPLLRTLIELYAELLYFLHQDDKTKIGLFAGQVLLSNSDHYRYVAIGFQGIKDEYERFLSLYKNLFDNLKIVFPADINIFSKKSLQASGFDFPNFDTILKPKYLLVVSDDTFSHWPKDSADNFYDKYYRTFSYYTHRGLTNQATSGTGNEKYWLAQFLFIIGQLMIELCNKKTFDLAYFQQYEELCQKVKIDYGEILKEWNAKRATEHTS
jgi:hypothetical protein